MGLGILFFGIFFFAIHMLVLAIRFLFQLAVFSLRFIPTPL